MTPHVSVIIPAYQAAPWIEASISSALNQDNVTTEVIVVDDGSRDETLDCARAAERKIADQGRLRVLTGPNAGASAARNRGLRAARGDWIQFLDADDLLAKDKLAQQIAALGANDENTLGLGRWGRFRLDKNTAHFAEESVYAARDGVDFLVRHYLEGGMAQPAAWLAPRALLAKVGPWDERLSLNDDGEYFARVALNATHIVHTPAALSYYRESGAGQLSRRRDPRALASLHLSVELTIGHLLAADDSPRVRAAAAYAWKRLACELSPDAPALSRSAESRCTALGGCDRPLPGGRAFRWLSRLLGWRLARRLTV
jgi:glycosyltransferase involved in cell wall biosynthesis